MSLRYAQHRWLASLHYKEGSFLGRGGLQLTIVHGSAAPDFVSVVFMEAAMRWNEAKATHPAGTTVRSTQVFLDGQRKM